MTRTVRLEVSPSRAAEWDLALQRANTEYGGRMHTLCWDNCHSHVGHALSNFKLHGHARHNMVTVWWYTVSKSRYVK